MTATSGAGRDNLLEASGVSKAYGAVVALRSASLAVRAGEVHALMGANGAGKSTLVKILTGAVRPDEGRISVRGRERTVHSPAEARRGGLVSVYQEPSLIPDLDVRSNLRLTETPLEPFRHWLSELGLERLDLRQLARRLPLAALRVIDLARALAIEPDVLMLDEMTAALPANLSERVLEVVGRRRGGDVSVLFISHRMIEIASLCDRATVLREGQTVGVVDVTAGSEDRIVELMLGENAIDAPELRADTPTPPMSTRVTPRLEVRAISQGTKLKDVSFELRPGEVLGMVALEGQGQDELFDILAGAERADSGEVLVDGVPLRTIGVRVYREQIAAVMQEDQLLSGSIADNICFFDPSFDHERMVTCTQMAGIHDEIMAMPMAYNSLIGDMGSSLSGGQKQRVLLARALYKVPKILFLDEGTAHLDVDKERQINERLRRLSITRISVAHRPEIMSGADKILRIGSGQR